MSYIRMHHNITCSAKQQNFRRGYILLQADDLYAKIITRRFYAMIQSTSSILSNLASHLRPHPTLEYDMLILNLPEAPSWAVHVRIGKGMRTAQAVALDARTLQPIKHH